MTMTHDSAPPPFSTSREIYGQPVTATYTLSIQGSTVNVVLLDTSGNISFAPSGGQTFTAFVSAGATLAATSITILQSQSTGQFVVSADASGVYLLTVQPTGGALAGLPAQQAYVNFDPDQFVVTNQCEGGVTRASLRDAIRRQLGFTPPVDNRPGANIGDAPQGESWPTTIQLNQAIGDAISKMNAKANWYVRTDITVTVPATTNQGVQWVPLVGVGGLANQNSILQVKRALWQPVGSSGGPYRLYPSDFNSMDRAVFPFDQYQPATPQWQIVTGYQIGLIPGSSQGGTLILWAGTGIPNFCSDTDTLTELPVDHIPLVRNLASVYINQTNMSRPESADQIGVFAKLAADGMDDFLKYVARISPQQQPSLRYGRRSPTSWRTV